MDIDLFRLYDPEEDLGPRSWIKVKGKFLFSIINLILKELTDKGVSRYSLSNTISKKLECHKDTVGKPIYGIVDSIQIPILVELLSL